MIGLPVAQNHYMTRTVVFTGRRVAVDPGTAQPVRDRYGNDTYVTVTFTVENCTWGPRGTSFENLDRGKAEQVEDDLTFYCLDPFVDIRATDEATIDGQLYQVVGVPQRFTASRFGNDHAVVVLKRVTG